MRQRTIGRVVSEFVLIVVGVMVALAGDSWLQSRSERNLETEHLERLAADIESTLQRWSSLDSRMAAGETHGLAVLPYLRGDEVPANPVGFVASVYHSTRAFFPTIIDDTYTELSLGPGLSLVRDSRLRSQLIRFFQRSDRGPLPGIVIVDNRAHREAVRRVVPAEMQVRIREECPIRREPLSCAAPIDSALAELASGQILASREVRETLNLWLQSLYQERRRVTGLQEQARRLLDALHAELGRTSGRDDATSTSTATGPTSPGSRPRRVSEGAD